MLMVPEILVRFKTRVSIGDHPFIPEGSLESLHVGRREGVGGKNRKRERRGKREGGRIQERDLNGGYTHTKRDHNFRSFGNTCSNLLYV